MFDKINCLFRTWNLSVGSKDFINLTWKHELVSHFTTFFIFFLLMLAYLHTWEMFLRSDYNIDV